jgi:hypothetical protein
LRQQRPHVRFRKPDSLRPMITPPALNPKP